MIAFSIMMFTGFVLTPNAFAGNIVICIDPGHGGTNQGALYNGYMEKNLTLQIANEMKQELSNYQGITVVMTRTTDQDLTLDQRAQIAALNGADFMYSIHLNATGAHRLYGSEERITGFGNQYAKGMTFGQLELGELTSQIGSYAKGVKCRMDHAGTDDYYGVISHARSYGIACAIIEHCYMDNPHDIPFTATPEALHALGKADATAVAKYYGLKSATLGVNYSKYPKNVVAATSAVHTQDFTAPDVCQIAPVSYDKGSGNATIQVTAADAQSNLIFYAYSTDNGTTWSGVSPWTNGNATANVSVSLPAGFTGTLLFRVYNMYDQSTPSNPIVLQ